MWAPNLCHHLAYFVLEGHWATRTQTDYNPCRTGSLILTTANELLPCIGLHVTSVDKKWICHKHYISTCLVLPLVRHTIQEAVFRCYKMVANSYIIHSSIQTLNLDSCCFRASKILKCLQGLRWQGRSKRGDPAYPLFLMFVLVFCVPSCRGKTVERKLCIAV